MVPKPELLNLTGEPSLGTNCAHKETSRKQKLQLQYDGFVYDVTTFADKHPGGNIIKMYLETQEDSYHAVQQFHFRSMDRVLKIMKGLPKRPIDVNGDSATREMSVEQKRSYAKLDNDFRELFNQCKEEGLFKPNHFHVFSRILELILLSVIGLYLSFSYDSSITKLIGSFTLALVIGRAGWVEHEGGHNSLTGNPMVDKYIAKLTMGLFLGLSNSWWNSQHSRHHAMPNNIHHDVDMKTLPFLAFNEKIVNKSSQLNFFIHYQKYLFATFDMILVSLSFTIQSICRVIKKWEYFEAIFIILHFYIIWKLGLLYGFLTIYLATVYFLVNFALSHTHLPVTTEPVHWVEYSLTHTTNVRSGKFAWVDYWMGYLNYQIEHHLFPTMPQYKNKLIRDRVKVLAKKHNLPYHLVDYTTAVRKVFDNLGQVSNELKEHMS